MRSLGESISKLGSSYYEYDVNPILAQLKLKQIEGVLTRNQQSTYSKEWKINQLNIIKDITIFITSFFSDANVSTIALSNEERVIFACYPADEHIPLIVHIYQSEYQNKVEISITATTVNFYCVSEWINEWISKNKVPTIEWHYDTGNGTKSINVPLNEVEPINDMIYPFVTGGVTTFFDLYLGSKSSVLVLIGEPGTGKSTFIKQLIHHSKKDAMIAYSEKVISSDRFLSEFITSKDYDILVIEDADTLIRDRESTPNHDMIKLLNISDGLIKNSNKKIVFSTNIKNTSDIDPALIRPGRCFDLMSFRPLDKAEAIMLKDSCGLNIEITKDSYTIAELFSEKNNPIVKTKVGFI